MNITAIDGREWTVRRRWLPRHDSFAHRWARRRRARGGKDVDGPWWDIVSIPLDLDDLFWLAIIVAVFLGLLFLGVPLLLAILDLALVAVLALGGVIARILLRRPWTVEAVSGDDRIERQVVGWRRAGDEVSALAHAVQHGQIT